jgi:hypothetical protein
MLRMRAVLFKFSSTTKTGLSNWGKNVRRCIQKFSYWVDNKTNNSNTTNKHTLRSNTKGYGVKTH